METTTKFEAGRTYSTRSIGDYNCIISITVASRTEKTIKTTEGKTLRIYSYDDGLERVRPWGKYSMSPVITAENTKTLLTEWEQKAAA
jgi:hypothetical protein